MKADLEAQVGNLQSLLNEEIGKDSAWEGEKQMLLAKVAMLEADVAAAAARAKEEAARP